MNSFDRKKYISDKPNIIKSFSRENNLTIENRKEILNKLIEIPKIVQRTDEWYKARENLLTASDLYDIVHHPLSIVKKKIKNSSFDSYSIPALRWGCMFEPIAINIYSYLTSTKINEFGLLTNKNINNFGASPDGITNDGIMIEIKCPYSREIINNVIPDKYYYQMQGQMAVCELDLCDYIECKFKTFNTVDEYIENIRDLENYKHGIFIEFKNNDNNNRFKYSTFNQDYENNIKEINEINNLDKTNKNNIIYWSLELINIQEVKFNKNKWDNEIISNIATCWNLYEEYKLKDNKDNTKKKIKCNFIEDDD